MRIYMKNRREKLGDEWRKNYREYMKKKYDNDKLNKFIINIRNGISVSFRRYGFTKKSKIQDILGCSYNEFKVYIESKFTEGMNWENRKEWHLDHIIPISWAKTEEEIIKLNHFTNFQPLWAIENMKKGNRYVR